MQSPMPPVSPGSAAGYTARFTAPPVHGCCKPAAGGQAVPPVGLALRPDCPCPPRGSSMPSAGPGAVETTVTAACRRADTAPDLRLVDGTQSGRMHSLRSAPVPASSRYSDPPPSPLQRSARKVRTSPAWTKCGARVSAKMLLPLLARRSHEVAARGGIFPQWRARGAGVNGRRITSEVRRNVLRRLVVRPKSPDKLRN